MSLSATENASSGRPDFRPVGRPGGLDDRAACGVETFGSSRHRRHPDLVEAGRIDEMSEALGLHRQIGRRADLS